MLARTPPDPRFGYVRAHGAGAGMRHPFLEAMALALFERVVRPFTWFLNVSAVGVLKIFGQKGFATEEGVHSPEELRMLVMQARG